MTLLSWHNLAALYPHADEDMQARIRHATDVVNDAAEERVLTAHFLLESDFMFRGYVPTGKDIRRHLTGCTEVVVGVCTLGAEIDRLLSRYQVSSLSDAYLVDQAASLAVENLAERTWRAIVADALARDMRATTRYSCGYGDYALSDQAALLALTGADKTLRITVNEGGMMYPTKTITFIAGISPRE